jgi:hypothetical protein
MWCIEPETLILLQDGKLRHHIVLTALAFQHGHPQRIQVPPSRFQTATVMAVTDELVGIGAATVGTLPVDRTRLTTDPTGTSLRASKLDRDFLLQKLLEYLGHPVDDNLLRLGFNGPENLSTLLCL